MKAKEFDIKKRDPNWRAMQNIRRSGAGGQHKDKKKAAKQGEVKHKGKDVAEGIGGTIVGGIGQFIGNKIDPLHGEIMRSHGEMAGRKAEYTIRKYMHLLQKALKQQLDSGEKEGVAEDFTYTTEKQILTRIRQIMYDRKLSGTESNAGELYRLKQQLKDMRSRSQQGVEEASDWGEPREILEDVLQTLEREVEWPLTEVMDPKEVKQLLSPIVRAVNDKMMNMKEAQDDWGGMSHKEFKRRELQHELGHEDDPDFERKMRQQQMDRDKGPWYIRIDGKIYKQKGEPKVFDWKKGANNYALAILKNKPDLQGKILLTKNPADQ